MTTQAGSPEGKVPLADLAHRRVPRPRWRRKFAKCLLKIGQRTAVKTRSAPPGDRWGHFAAETGVLLGRPPAPLDKCHAPTTEPQNSPIRVNWQREQRGWETSKAA
jgi:hypothetical protein